jgi:hypothetical protein
MFVEVPSDDPLSPEAAHTEIPLPKQHEQQLQEQKEPNHAPCLQPLERALQKHSPTRVTFVFIE